MKNKLSAFVGLLMLAPGVYGQQTYTFTNCGATGQSGPTQLQVNNTYGSGNSLNGAVGVTSTGIQTWTVPFTGDYHIIAKGAQGGNTGGLGATMSGEFTLNGGEVLYIIVGHEGDNGGSGPGGGGGGSFVVRTPYNTNASILVIAGGGSGNGNYSFTGGAITNNGVTGGVAGGTNGNGGLGGTRGAGGGGFFTDGAPCTANVNYASPGKAFVNGGQGGAPTNNCSYTAGGGFGGGSSHGGNCINNGGAGGGYSGGGGSSNTTSGGGGSYNSGINQANTANNNSGNGIVIITQLAQPCSASIETPTITGSVPENSICLHAGETENLGVIYDGVAYVGVDYNWFASSSPSGPFSIVGTTNDPAFTTSGMGATAVYYKVEATCVSAGVMVASDIFATLPNPTITLASAPFINFNSSSLVVCTNDHYTITASGAVTYDWINGSGQAIGVNPYVLMPMPAFPDYTVTGISAEGCTDTNTMTIATILESPLVSAVSLTNSICKGGNVTLFSSGNVLTYTWSSNANNSTAPVVVVSPVQSQVYVVAGTAANGCTASASKSITVYVPAEINATSSKPNGICVGETAELTASGAITYTWASSSGMFQGAEIEVSPVITTNYIITSNDENGCENTGSVQQRVFACVGVTELGVRSDELRVYPNPNNGAFSIELNNGGLQKTLELFDLTGRKVLSNTTHNDMINLDVSELQNGVYFLNVKSNNTVETVKIIKH